MTIWRKLGIVALGVALVAMCTVLATVLTLVTTPKPVPKEVWATEPFPASLAIERVLFADQDGFLREGCVVAYLQISEVTARKIEAGGLNGLQEQRVARNGKQLTSWRRGPIEQREDPVNPGFYREITAEGEQLYVRPMTKCSTGLADPPSASLIFSEMASGEAYYSTFSGGEGMIIVAPRVRRAAYYYFG